MSFYIHEIHNISSPIIDAVYKPDYIRNFKRCYSKAVENWKVAFSKKKYENIQNSYNSYFKEKKYDEQLDFPHNKPPKLYNRVVYFFMGCVYAFPIINLIVYIAKNRFQPREKYRILPYEEAIEKAVQEFSNSKNGKEIIDRVKKRLKDCHYKENIKDGKKLQIDIRDDDYFGKMSTLTDDMQINYKAINFIHRLPEMHIASVPDSFYQKNSF